MKQKLCKIRFSSRSDSVFPAIHARGNRRRESRELHSFKCRIVDCECDTRVRCPQRATHHTFSVIEHAAMIRCVDHSGVDNAIAIIVVVSFFTLSFIKLHNHILFANDIILFYCVME